MVKCLGQRSDPISTYIFSSDKNYIQIVPWNINSKK